LGEREKHWDGSDWVQLPEVNVIDAHEYDPRLLPAVVTDTVMGNVRTLSFNHVIAGWRDDYGLYGPVDATYQVFGGRGDFDVALYCGANDRELQQKITDVTATYLTIGRGWLWYYRYVLLGDVRMLGDGVEGEVQQERVWYANMSIPATADWRLLVPRETVERFDPDIETVTPDDPFGDPVHPTPGIFTPLDPEEARGRLLEMRAVVTQPKPPEQDLSVEQTGDQALPLRPMRSAKDS